MHSSIVLQPSDEYSTAEIMEQDYRGVKRQDGKYNLNNNELCFGKVPATIH
jgi:hypothetical protein